MPTSSLDELRRQYPKVALITDLLMVHENHYVVKAQIQTEGQLLATAMAADLTLETAEDRACLRAIERLCPPSLASSPAADRLPKAQPPSVSPPDRSAAEIAGSVANLSTSPPTLAVQEAVPDLEASLAARKSPAPELQLADDPGLPATAEEAAAAPEEPLWSHTLEATAPGGQTLAAELPALETPASSLVSPGPVDLSDIIAQTDVELRRLGWTVAQGREFLEKTYGKRSRHDLADQELLEFLLYLEMQPSPVER